MSTSKRQSLIMTGVCLLLLSVIMLYFALTQPNVTESGIIEDVSSSQSNQGAAAVQITQSELSGASFSSAVSNYNEEQVYYDTVGESDYGDYDDYYDDDLAQAADDADNDTQSAQMTETTEFTGVINLNTCTAEELIVLDGIGEAKAEAIIQYREYIGGYTSVEQIKNIKGIGDKIFEKISPYLTV